MIAMIYHKVCEACNLHRNGVRDGPTATFRSYSLSVSFHISFETRPGGQRCVLKLLFHFSFFFTLLIAPSSTSLLSPRPSFLRVHPSSSSLLPPRPSFFLVQPFFIHLDESVTDGRTNGRTDKASYRDARTHLKRERLGKLSTI